MRMKISSIILKNFFVCLILLAFTNFCTAMDEDEALFQDAQRGFTLYQEGKYLEASPLLKRAIEGGDFRFLTTYAEICDGNLDDQDHPPTEVARLYLKGAEIGDGDAYSYLASLSEDLVNGITGETMPQKIQELILIWARQETSLGVEFYQDEDYPRAAQLLKKAARKNNTIAQHFYGEICLHQLDGVPHSYQEAAMYYLLSARGDTDLLSYFKAHIPGILEDEDYETQMKRIVGYWVREATFKHLKKLTPDKVNKYIMWVRKKGIDKTTAMKFPYLFERVLTAILCENEIEPVSVMDDVMIPQGKESSEEVVQQPLQSCGMAACLANQTFKSFDSCMIPAQFGPMYFNYFKSLDDKERLKPPPSQPKMKPLYRLLLEAISEESPKTNTASQLSDISHDDYPWLWAGIKYWKKRYDKKPFDFTSLTEKELLKRLTDFSPLSEDDIGKVRGKLEAEDRDFWPNNDESSIATKYNDRMHAWFTNPLSWETKIVKKIKQSFYNKLKTHTLDCSKEEEREILKTPILMFYCEDLTLDNFSSSKSCCNALKEAQRYFVKLKLTISTTPDFNNKSKSGKNIQELVNVLYERGIDITLL
jgi:hypothetical protein